MGKEFASNAGDTGDMSSSPGSGRSPVGGHGNPVQYSYLENLMDRGALWVTVHRVTKELDMMEATEHTLACISLNFLVATDNKGKHS